MITPSANTVVVRDAKDALFLETDSILRIEAVNNYSQLFLADGRKITVSKVLKQFENILNGYGFARIHRSDLVNRSWVQLYYASSGELQMKNNEMINVARRRKGNVKRNLFKQGI